MKKDISSKRHDKQNKTAEKTAFNPASAGYFLIPFFIMLLSLVIESCLVFNEKTGLFGVWIYNLFVGLFGSAAYFLPAGALVIAFFFNSISEKKTTAYKSVMLSVFICFLATLNSLFSIDGLAASPVSIPDYFIKGYNGEGGGVIGGLIGKLMSVIFGNVISAVFTVIICIFSLSFFLGTTKAGLWLYLRELRMFGAEKTATPKEQKKEPEKISSKEQPKKTEQPAPPAPTFGQLGSIPTVFSGQKHDPFRYGTEVGMSGSKKPSMSIDLRSPEKQAELPKDIYSEEPEEQTPPPEIRIQQPSVPLETGNGRAYSPFADPFTKRDEFMRNGAKPEQSEPQSTSVPSGTPSRAYSPFSAPFAKRPDPVNRNAPAQGGDFDTATEIKVASKTAFADSPTGTQSGQASGGVFAPPSLGQQATPNRSQILNQPPFSSQPEIPGSILGQPAPAGIIPPSAEQMQVGFSGQQGAFNQNTEQDRSSGASNGIGFSDQKQERSAPWDVSVGSSASFSSSPVNLTGSSVSDDEYEDAEDVYQEDSEEAFVKKEELPSFSTGAFSTGAFKNAYADRYNSEKQRSEAPPTEQSAYKDHSEKFYPNYVYPSSVLLEQRSSETTVTEEDVIEVRNKLLGKLASFRIEASLVGYSAGPTVTRYEIAPGPGVTVKAITNRIEDIGLELQSDGVRIATVPGKSVIGIEVPNKKVSVVSLRSLIENRDFMEARSKITVCVGLTVTGKPVYMDIDDMPHVLIAGQTKSGKSVAINCMLLSLLYRTTPDEVQLILIDPKRVELNIYSKVPHLAMPVIDDPQRAAAALRWAVNEMERRYEMMDTLGVRNRDEYYELKEQDPSLEYMPQIVIIIDELADLMLQVREHVETLINRLAAKARACGIHLVVGTQRPSVDIVTGLIKANIPARISFQVSSSADSRIILGTVGAEKLLGRGDMLYQATGAGRVRLQGAFVSSSEIKRVTGFIIENNGEAEFDPEIMRQLDAETDKINKTNKKAASQYESDGDGDFDSDIDFEYICKAMEYIFETKTTTTNNIQRRLRIGFNRAADIVDELENLGFISGRNGSKQRDILIDYEDFEQWKLRNAP